MKMLLLEPDRLLGPAMAELLQANGHQVELCRTAQGALDALDQQTPELIILELQLGIHNGLEFLYEMRSYLEWQQIPVIAHTINRHALEESFKDAFAQLGVQRIFYKPTTTFRQLLQTVEQLTMP